MSARRGAVSSLCRRGLVKERTKCARQMGAQFAARRERLGLAGGPSKDGKWLYGEDMTS